jgi:putative sigma-54 modulation protein
MQPNITGHHVEITPALRTFVNDKMQRISRHF